MLFRKVRDEECRNSEEYGGLEFYCPVCKENCFSDRDYGFPFPCDHSVFVFQRAKGCNECDIAAAYRLKNIDNEKLCSCWNFNTSENYGIPQRANEIEKKTKYERLSDHCRVL